MTFDSLCRAATACLTLVALHGPGPARAAGMPALVEAMLANAPAAAEARCSYTRIRVDGEDSKRERYQAGAEATPWSLQQVDGRPPSDAELQRYARGADDRERRHPLAFDLRAMVDPEHWRPLSETESQATFEFRLRPNEDLDPALVDKVRGTLVVDKVRHQPQRILIENTEPAYAAPLVRIAEYRQEMLFDWNADIGAAVLTQAETRWRGRAFGLKVLRKHKLVRYTDYDCRPSDDVSA